MSVCSEPTINISSNCSVVINTNVRTNTNNGINNGINNNSENEIDKRLELLEKDFKQKEELKRKELEGKITKRQYKLLRAQQLYQNLETLKQLREQDRREQQHKEQQLKEKQLRIQELKEDLREQELKEQQQQQQLKASVLQAERQIREQQLQIQQLQVQQQQQQIHQLQQQQQQHQQQQSYIARQRLHQALYKKKLTEAEVIDRVGCNRNHIYNWLNYTECLFCNEGEDAELDHFFPLKSFAFSNNNHMNQVNHWSNLRYLPKSVNRAKSARLPTMIELNEHLTALYQYLINNGVKDISRIRKGSQVILLDNIREELDELERKVNLSSNGGMVNGNKIAAKNSDMVYGDPYFITNVIVDKGIMEKSELSSAIGRVIEDYTKKIENYKVIS